MVKAENIKTHSHLYNLGVSCLVCWLFYLYRRLFKIQYLVSNFSTKKIHLYMAVLFFNWLLYFCFVSEINLFLAKMKEQHISILHQFSNASYRFSPARPVITYFRNFITWNFFILQLIKPSKEKAFCKSTSHILANIPHPTSQTSHIPNIPHPEHPTSRTSHIPNIPHPEHPTSCTSHIPNIPHPEHPTSRTSHIPNILHPEHPTSRTSHIPNMPHPEHPTSRISHIPNIPHPRHPTSRTSHIPNIPHPKHPTF